MTTGDATLNGSGTLNNAGTFQKAGGNGTTTLSATLNNGDRGRGLGNPQCGRPGQ